jgi:cytochrome b subunit of formate dehydrogenase
LPERYRRFSVAHRVEHWVQLTAFVALAFTGLPQRYDGAWLSLRIIDLLGGIDTVRVIHRVFAAALMLATVYHFAAVGYRKYVLREPRTMIPDITDLRAVGRSVVHAIGFRPDPPAQGRFGWEEKVEYWALIWGTGIMVLTGFFLWNPIATTAILPGEFVPAARVAHSAEALLAVLAVIVWHAYHVHIRHLNKSIYGGYLTREEMEEYHPLELESLERGDYVRPPAEAIRRRARRYLPVAITLSGILLVGVYLFIVFESTAISTVEPIEGIEGYAPVETTSTTVGPGGTTTTTTVPGAPTWESGIAAVFGQCAGCHGGDAPTAGLDLSTYQGIIAGGSSGPGIVPGNPDGGTVVAKMGGAHAVVLSPEDLATVRAWIAAGAAEAEDGTTTTTLPAALGWADFAPIFTERCLLCHAGADPVAGLDLSGYDTARAGGVSGPGLVPGDPAASSIFRTMVNRDHALIMTLEEIEALRVWILGGAEER